MRVRKYGRNTDRHVAIQPEHQSIRSRPRTRTNNEELCRFQLNNQAQMELLQDMEAAISTNPSLTAKEYASQFREQYSSRHRESTSMESGSQDEDYTSSFQFPRELIDISPPVYWSSKDGRAPDDSYNYRPILHAWYFAAFGAIYQSVCKRVAEIWIGAIQPSKQQQCPYTVNKIPQPGPKWWPEGVEHRGPHHLKEEARKALLVYILVALWGKQTVDDKLINADLLHNALKPHEKAIKAERPSGMWAWAMLERIYSVRKQEEHYETSGDWPGCTKKINLCEVPKPPRGARGKRKRKSPRSSHHDQVMPDELDSAAYYPTNISEEGLHFVINIDAGHAEYNERFRYGDWREHGNWSDASANPQYPYSPSSSVFHGSPSPQPGCLVSHNTPHCRFEPDSDEVVRLYNMSGQQAAFQTAPIWSTAQALEIEYVQLASNPIPKISETTLRSAPQYIRPGETIGCGGSTSMDCSYPEYEVVLSDHQEPALVQPNQVLFGFTK